MNRKLRDYPIAISSTGKGSWYDWLSSDGGRAATEPSILSLGREGGQYLENRLWRAYIAGLREGYKQGTAGESTEAEDRS